jgi:hypothetical protein
MLFLRREGAMPKNHLDLRETLLEFDAEGNLSVFSNGKSTRLTTEEVEAFRTFLNQVEAQTASTERLAFARDARGIVSMQRQGLSLQIPAGEVQRIQEWLNSHRRR